MIRVYLPKQIPDKIINKLIKNASRSHEGHVEVANGEVVLAIIDGRTIHSNL